MVAFCPSVVTLATAACRCFRGGIRFRSDFAPLIASPPSRAEFLLRICFGMGQSLRGRAARVQTLLAIVSTQNFNAMTSRTISLEESLARIAAIDLEAVKFKLVRGDAQRWNAAKADVAETTYKRFLQLCLVYSEQPIVPTPDVDEMWHCHILDTRAYARDCEYALGFFLHHWPYAGTLGPDDEAELHVNFAATCALYVNEFGESYPTAASCTGCNRPCDSDAHALIERQRSRLERDSVGG